MNSDVIIDSLSKWTKSQRNGLYVGGYLFVVAIYVFLFLFPSLDSIKQYENELGQKQSDLDLVKQQVGSISDLEAQSIRLRMLLDNAKKALPAGKEIPDLIGEISERGRKVGLEISKFNPLGETMSADNEFVAEVPIQLAVEGSYHDIAIFFDKLSRMDRIVHIKNIDMEIEEEESSRTRLIVEGSAITFRFLSDEERAERNKKNKNNKRGRR